MYCFDSNDWCVYERKPAEFQGFHNSSNECHGFVWVATYHTMNLNDTTLLQISLLFTRVPFCFKCIQNHLSWVMSDSPDNVSTSNFMFPQQEMGQESADIQAGFEKLNTARRESHRIAGSGAGWFRSFLKFSATTAYRVGYRDHAIREWLPRHGNTGKWYTRNAQVTVTTGKPQWFERKEILSQFVTKVYNFQGTVRKRCKAVEGVEVWKGGRIFFEIGLRVLWDFCYLGRVCSVKFKQIFSLQTCWRQKSDTE